jgi:hypothetical protein
MLIHIFEIFFVIWKYNMIFFYFWETWLYAWKPNIFYVLTKNKYFNIGFVSLQYKNTNQYWSKWSKKFAENHKFFEIIFEDWLSNANLREQFTHACYNQNVIKLHLHSVCANYKQKENEWKAYLVHNRCWEKSLLSLSLGFWEEVMMPLPASGFPFVLSSPRVRLFSSLCVWFSPSLCFFS